MPPAPALVYGGGGSSGHRHHAKAGGFCFRGTDISVVKPGNAGAPETRRAAIFSGRRAGAWVHDSYQAAAGADFAIASSSNAVEMSRMLTTPIRL